MGVDVADFDKLEFRNSRGRTLLFRLLTQDLILSPKWQSGNEFFGWPQELEKPGEKKHKVGLENAKAF